MARPRLICSMPLAALLALLASCSRQSPPPTLDHKALEELEAGCSRDARDWFAKVHGKDRVPPDQYRDFASHYHAGSSRCLAVLNTTVVKGYVSTQIVDVHRGIIAGTFLANAGETQPAKCEMDGKRCHSSDEWRALTGPYLHE